MLLPVLDLLLLLTVTFIALSGLFGAVGAFDTANEDRAKIAGLRIETARLTEELDALQSQDEALEQELADALAELAPLREAYKGLEAAKADAEETQRQIDELTAMLKPLRPAIAALERQVSEAEERLSAHEVDNRDVAALTEQLERLRSDVQERQQQLVNLRAELETAGENAYSLSTGWPQTNRRTPKLMDFLLLADGKVYPVVDPFFIKTEVATDTTLFRAKNPAQPGLALPQTLELLEEVLLTPEYRRSGRVILLVNSDSFASFRIIRDVLAKNGIDYGWDPIEGTSIVFGSDGRTIPGQGRM